MSSHSLPEPSSVTLGNYYTRICLDPQVKEHPLKALHQLCQRYWVPTAHNFGVAMPQISGPLLCQILKVCLVHNQQEIFDLFVAHNQQPVPLEFFTWTKEKLAHGPVPWEKLVFM
jgi:hypothetical protein